MHDDTTHDTPSAASRWSVIAWWVATLVTLVVLDDLTFGPVFWLISRLGSTWLGVAVVFAVYVPAQVFIVYRGTEPEPGRVAAFFLRRFALERRVGQVARNERALQQRVLGAGTAILLSLVIGGVLPPLLLWRRGVSRTEVRRLSVVTATVYAAEFAVLHAVVPGSI